MKLKELLGFCSEKGCWHRKNGELSVSAKTKSGKKIEILASKKVCSKHAFEFLNCATKEE